MLLIVSCSIHLNCIPQTNDSPLKKTTLCIQHYNIFLWKWRQILYVTSVIDDSICFSLWRQVDTISDFLFSRLGPLCFKISDFSLIHRAHLPFTGLYVRYCPMGSQAIAYVPPSCLILQTSLDNDVSLLYFLFAKDFLWLPNLLPGCIEEKRIYTPNDVQSFYSPDQ